jgi:hypothetical protein
VIHENLPKNINVNDKNLSHEEFKPFRYYDYINQKQLNDFNRKYNNIKVVLLSKNKLDGSLLALSSGLPNPFIAPKMNFVREDFCAQQFFTYKNIKQYNISNILKGHNYKHPLKRTNTRNTRNDEKFKKMERYNLEQMKIFINKIKNEE